MAQAQSDRNLLLGILAYQNAFISKEALLAGMQTWLYDKAKPLADVLHAQGALDGPRRTLLEALVEQHLKQHGDDPRKSLQAVSSVSSVREPLEQLADPEVQASIACLAQGNDADPPATITYSVGAASSAGTRFRILRPHARGGLGQVSVAHDTELNREVALKEIQVRYADRAESRTRFLLEAEITGGLEHPGIVPVYGLGTYADGRPFYAMRPHSSAPGTASALPCVSRKTCPPPSPLVGLLGLYAVTWQRIMVKTDGLDRSVGCVGPTRARSWLASRKAQPAFFIEA